VTKQAKPSEKPVAPDRKVADNLAYPPLGFGVDRAAAYLGMSTRKFLELVDDGRMPRPVRIDGCVIWSRLALDAAFQSLEHAAGEANTADAALRKMGM
jgi:predicted DNA-binding transcriptional regulator AlpA